jgi:hypothetical protein
MAEEGLRRLSGSFQVRAGLPESLMQGTSAERLPDRLEAQVSFSGGSERSASMPCSRARRRAVAVRKLQPRRWRGGLIRAAARMNCSSSSGPLPEPLGR